MNAVRQLPEYDAIHAEGMEVAMANVLEDAICEDQCLGALWELQREDHCLLKSPKMSDVLDKYRLLQTALVHVALLEVTASQYQSRGTTVAGTESLK
jgi:hypothetical protein